MEIFISSFIYAGGPFFVVCFFFGWSPYFCNSYLWNDANFQDPIRLGLQSSLYSHILVAGIAAAFPSCLELIFYGFFSRGNSFKRTILIISNIFIFIFPEIISLLLVIPTSDCKLYYLLLNNRTSSSLFSAMLLLCRFSEKSWRCKLSTVTTSFIYFGSLVSSLAPYSTGFMGSWIQKLGPFLQFIGCIVFIIQSYKFLCPNSVAKESKDITIVDDLLCKFVTFCVLFVIICMCCVHVSAGFPYWTQWNSTYIVCCSLILAVPNVVIGVAYAHATRNETVFLQQMKQMYINYISHEMRTPLNTAVMGLQLLRSELINARAGGEIITILEEVSDACEVSVTILSEMLDFDKLQSGGMKMELEEVSVKEFLETTISPFYLQAIAKDVLLECNLNSGLSNLFANIDKSKFAQVIRNLLSNALKFTPPGGTVTITATITPCPLLSNHTTTGSSPSSQLLTILVTDTGAGISKENQEKLFKEMVQFNPAKLQNGGGSGLGLFISKGIMDLLHGSLSISSEGEGHGCTFTITMQATYNGNLINVEIPEAKDDTVILTPDECVGAGTGNNNSSLSEGSAGRTPNLRRAESVPFLLSTRVLPLVRPDSARSSVALMSGHRSRYDGGLDSTTDRRSVGSMLKVLVVDDSTSNRKMLKRLLRDRCSVIDEAVDGVEAVSSLHAVLLEEGQRQYDAVLMDFIMPNMEGPEAARCMRELGYTGLIIGITGNVLLSDKQSFLSHGANVVLTKPINISDIDNAFARLPCTTPYTMMTVN